MSSTADGSVTSIDDVIITPELGRRPARTPDYAAECRALSSLAQAMAESPKSVFQKLADFALELCGAGSAGISVWDPTEANVFRWRATAGAYAPYVGGTLPRDFSPCGTVLDRNACLLMREPVRVFPYIADLSSPAREVLLVPFYQAGVAIGTVWVVAHDDMLHFDAEDARIVTSLTKFAEVAILTLNRIEAAERAERLRREREEHFHALVTATSDVVYRMSADWSEMHPIDGRGVAGNAAPIRDWIEKKVPEWEHARVREAIAKAIANKQVFELEHQAIRANGALAWTFSRAIPILDPEGAIVEWLGTASDVTGAKLAEASLRDFIATLAHELRNPLAPISTGVSLLSDAEHPELAHKTLGVMRRQVDHMVCLIEDLLDVSRITQGKLELRRECVSIASVVQAAIEGNQLHVDRAGHTLCTTLSREELLVDADHTRLAQVIGNLLNNACKYTPDGGRIELRTRRDGDDAVITVSDSGVGIPQSRIDDVFEMFSQVDRVVDRSRGGLGIGLSLVRRLVQMHGGSVSAFSEGTGRGSTFTVRLPLAQGAVMPATASSKAIATPALGTRVLVVDDNDDAAELLSIWLENAGYAATRTHDAKAALEIASGAAPDVVILDIGLPDMNGYELVQRLREMPQLASAVFIALTGWGTQADRRRALEAGFDVHLTKPVSGGDLRAALGRASRMHTLDAAPSR